MTETQFNARVIAPLQSRVALRDLVRLINAYADILRIVRLTEWLERYLSDKNAFYTGLVRGTKEDRALVDLLPALLKAEYMFAGVFVELALTILAGHRLKSVPVSAVVRDAEDPLFSRLDQNALLEAYTISMYRNKIVAHGDIPRRTVYEIGPGTTRLFPSAKGVHFTKKEQARLRALKSRNAGHIPALAADENWFYWPGLLFHGIPVGPRRPDKDGKHFKVSSDREAIDKLVEHVGCRSLTCSDLLASVDRFSLALKSLVVPLRKFGKVLRSTNKRKVRPLRR